MSDITAVVLSIGEPYTDPLRAVKPDAMRVIDARADSRLHLARHGLREGCPAPWVG